MDNEEFKWLLKSSGNADQYFFPFEISSWKDVKGGIKYSIDECFRVQPHIGGVRFHEWDRTGNNPAMEMECQYDLSKAIEAIRELRKRNGYRNLIISSEFVNAKQNSNDKGKRVKLGLFIPTNKTFANDIVAARHCYLNLRRAIKKSGFSIEHPRDKFDASSGMEGLQNWSKSLKLRRRKPSWPLLLIPLLLAPIIISQCDKSSLLGMDINTKSFIFIVDRSSSMKPTIYDAQQEVDRLVKELLKKRNFFSTYYADIVSYNDAADSALGNIEKLNDDTALRLNAYLKNLEAGGSTLLESAIERAAREVVTHNRPTTLLIVTDAEDGSIRKMANNIQDIKQKFGGVAVYVNSTTPRILKEKDSIPKGNNETDLKRFSELLNGKFGNSGETK